MTKLASSTVIYQSKNGALELQADTQRDTIWANLMQISALFATDKSGISRHIRNIYTSKELPKKGTVANFATVQKEGNREIRRDVEHYSLDMILSIGYRVNSKKATHFRQWATKTLKEHIQKGYTINRHRIKTNYDEFLKAVSNIKSVAKNATVDNDSVLELVTLFADTWFSLDAYDRDTLSIKGSTKKKVALTADKLTRALAKLKQNLITKGEATELFGAERTQDSIAGIVGNVMQSFGGSELYPSIEEKAAHLLYFIIKNHPFIDGNKRSAAYAFIWFLNYTKILNVSRITPPALTALTLLVAESAPKDKNRLIGLVCAILIKN
ncbi:MAG: virulence protein RhuM/Fic/DOC family protein [Coxiellaceae bacterium]|nr:virulence protein RhuM/Fic/DOC family protein [Coxiellaceae bacterium]